MTNFIIREQSESDNRGISRSNIYKKQSVITKFTYSGASPVEEVIFIYLFTFLFVFRQVNIFRPGTILFLNS